MIKKNKFILISFLLGILYSILFFQKDRGISFALFVTVLLMFFAYVLKEYKLLNKNKAWIFVLPILLLSFRYSVNMNPFLDFLNHKIIIILFVGMTILLVSKIKINWGSFKFILDMVQAFFKPVGYFNKPYKFLTKNNSLFKGSKYKSILVKVLFGLVLSIPFLLIIIGLLSSADMVFNEYVLSLPKVFGNLNVGNFILRTILVIFIGTYIYSYLYSLLRTYLRPKKKVTNKDNKRINFDSTIMITVLVVVNLVYILFCIIQFSYLFVGGANALPGNLSYSEYARKGFFELIFVTIINFSIILVVLYNLHNKIGIIRNTVKSLLLIIGGSTFVMLYSSFYRMSLYQENYGYTYLRIYVYFFLLVEAIALIGTISYIIKQNFNLGKMYVIIFLVCYIGLNYLNVDKVIAKSNVDRYFENGSVDVYYLKNLSYDGIPDIARLLDSNDEKIKKQVKEYLIDVKEELNQKSSWIEFNYSKYKAKEILNKI